MPRFLFLVALVGLIAFLLISNTFSFRDTLFSNLFPKPASHASGLIGGYDLGVKYGRALTIYDPSLPDVFGNDVVQAAFAGKWSGNSSLGWDKASQVANLAYIQRAWNDVDTSNPTLADEVSSARSRGMKIHISFDPLCTDRSRVANNNPAIDSCDPSSPSASFYNLYPDPNNNAYVNKVREIAQAYQPDYFIIGLEFEGYKTSNPQDYNYFIQNLYPKAYAAIHQVTQNKTKVAVSYAYAFTNPGGLTSFVNDFTSYGGNLDVLAISLYPFTYVYSGTPVNGSITPNWGNINDHLFEAIILNSGRPDLPLFISETGMTNHSWAQPTSNITFVSGASAQSAWIEKLKTNAENARQAGKNIAAINYVSLIDTFCGPDQLQNPIIGYWCYFGLLDMYGDEFGFSAMSSWKQSLAQTTTPTPTPIIVPPVTPTPIPTAFIPGDINRNGRVEVFDFNLLITDFGKMDIVSLRSDVNHNGRVDVFDFSLLISNFGRSSL